MTWYRFSFYLLLFIYSSWRSAYNLCRICHNPRRWWGW